MCHLKWLAQWVKMCLGLTVHPATADNLAAIYVMLRFPNIPSCIVSWEAAEESYDSKKHALQSELLKQS